MASYPCPFYLCLRNQNPSFRRPFYLCHYPCLYMHLSNGEPICYEFGNKKPCREFRKGERIEVKLKGGFYNPVEKLY